jgi:hypothetical protein
MPNSWGAEIEPDYVRHRAPGPALGVISLVLALVAPAWLLVFLYFPVSAEVHDAMLVAEPAVFALSALFALISGIVAIAHASRVGKALGIAGESVVVAEAVILLLLLTNLV